MPIAIAPGARAPALLAFDSATEWLSIALGVGTRVWLWDGAGGAQASAALIPQAVALMAQAGIGFEALDAIAYGAGPGAFTGLRTACAVAQGLAYGAEVPVLALDTLLVVAEDARQSDAPASLWVAMDARMDEVYAAHYTHDGHAWQVDAPPALLGLPAFRTAWQARPGAVAGTAVGPFADRLEIAAALRWPDALPRARALLPLAQAAWRAGAATAAAAAHPRYLRDNVALTTAQRLAVVR